MPTSDGQPIKLGKVYPGGLTGQYGRRVYPRMVDLEAWADEGSCPWCDHETNDVLEHAENQHPTRAHQALDAADRRDGD